MIQPREDLYVGEPNPPAWLSREEKKRFRQVARHLIYRRTLGKSDREILIKYVRLSVVYDKMLVDIGNQGDASKYKATFPTIGAQFNQLARILGIGTLFRMDPKIRTPSMSGPDDPARDGLAGTDDLKDLL